MLKYGDSRPMILGRARRILWCVSKANRSAC